MATVVALTAGVILVGEISRWALPYVLGILILLCIMTGGFLSFWF